MKLIVGLGNPGKNYSLTRHNIGFMILDALAGGQGIRLKNQWGRNFASGRAKIENINVLLAKPRTFMNLSGLAVSSLIRKHKIDLSDLMVICDDLDLDFGRMKLKSAGSSGGQKGLNSIIAALGRDDFCRLRIGVGSPGRVDAADYVLSPFSREEKKSLGEIISRASDCILSWVTQGTEKTMNLFNKKE